MIKKTLEQLYAEGSEKVSDKWSLYLVEYGRIFDKYREQPIALLEIGIQNGGSLEIWTKFFANARKFVGCDINPDCARLFYEDPRVTVVVGDANSVAVQKMVLQHAPILDVIIDDGSHRSSDIIMSFARYFPHLADGGIFVVEDLHCSYWAEFEGGLFHPFSSITFFKRLADIVNHEHWGVAKSRADFLRGLFLKFDFQIDEDVLAQIHSVEFVNSMCIVRKEASPDNSLGIRFISGLDESIVQGGLTLKSTSSSTPSQTANTWATRAVPPDEEVLLLESSVINLNKHVLNLDKKIQHLDKEVANRDEKIAILASSKDTIVNSYSWKITKPLRFLGDQIEKILRKFGT
jgi:hypothetical protein